MTFGNATTGIVELATTFAPDVGLTVTLGDADTGAVDLMATGGRIARIKGTKILGAPAFDAVFGAIARYRFVEGGILTFTSGCPRPTFETVIFLCAGTAGGVVVETGIKIKVAFLGPTVEGVVTQSSDRLLSFEVIFLGS